MKLLLSILFIFVVIIIVSATIGGDETNNNEITVVSWGGAYSNSQIQAYHKPYIAKTNVQIKSQNYNGGLAEIKTQVESGNISWDIVDVEPADAVRGCDSGLLEALDHSILPSGSNGTPATEDFLPGTLYECGVANIIWSTIIAFDKTKFKTPPSTMADFFNLHKFPGKRGMQKTAKNNLEFALVADGVAANNVYNVLSTPRGVNRAFEKLNQIKNHIIWWENGSQPPQMLASGEVAITTAYNGQIFNAIAQNNKPFEIVWDGQIWDLDLWVIPKGSKQKQIALDFIKFSTQSEQLAKQASYISYGPARKSSIDKVGKFYNSDIEMAKHLPTHPDNMKNSVQNNFEFWIENGDRLNDRFNQWFEN